MILCTVCQVSERGATSYACPRCSIMTAFPVNSAESLKCYKGYVFNRSPKGHHAVMVFRTTKNQIVRTYTKMEEHIKKLEDG